MNDIQKIVESFNKTVPELIEQRTELYLLRDKVAGHFTKDKLSTMQLDDYCLGMKKDYTNLSYALEKILDGLGRISGRSGASKMFGVWYSTTVSTFKMSPTYKKKFDNHVDAFQQLKRDLVELYDYGISHDLDGISNSQLDDWLKGKFLATIFPDDYLNVYSRDRLLSYIKYLGITPKNKKSTFLREVLIKWKNETPVAKDWPLDIFGCFLWQLNDIIDGDDEDEISTVEKSIDAADKSKIFLDFVSNCLLSDTENQSALLSEMDSWIRTRKNDFQGIMSINTEEDAKDLYDELLSWNEIPDKNNSHEKFQQIGGGKYNEALLMYIRFLHAVELCAQISEYRAKSGNDKAAVVSYDKYLTALRTKPFLLLAGISGTGKSRIVREMAFRSCPDIDDLRADSTTPGNYLMIEVKPNWHDSSELLGYYSNISKKYVLTPFIKFLVKAKKYPDVPFFVCLDEMNLAPVEQYFAEFLSILETRRMTGDGIKSGALVKKEHLTELGETVDLSLPKNVFIVGTVNMDDTTHQFSRKVIDRAMTIEMNGGNFEDMFGHSSDLDYPANDNVWTMGHELLTQYVNADEVNESHQQWAEKIKSELPKRLDAINKCLKNTPFEVSYRVLNELCIYLGVLLDDERDVDDTKFNELVDKAVDQIMLMKILPRIEGDAEMFNLTEDDKKDITNKETITDKLKWLQDICPNVTAADDSMTSKKKLDEMISRMKSGFTRYWP